MREVIVGACIALAGVLFGEFFQFLRARGSRAEGRRVREEDRRAELWNLSRPAAARLQDQLITVLRLAEPPLPYHPSSDTSVPFEEGFPEWWIDQDRSVEREIALLPSQAFRDAMTTIRRGIGEAWALPRAGYGASHQDAVRRIAEIGLEAIAAWLRDERSLPPEVAQALSELGRYSNAVEEWWSERDEANAADAGPQPSAEESRPVDQSS